MEETPPSFTIAACVISAGTVGLTLGEPTALRVFFAAIRLLITVGAVVAVWHQCRTIRRKIAARSIFAV